MDSKTEEASEQFEEIWEEDEEVITRALSEKVVEEKAGAMCCTAGDTWGFVSSGDQQQEPVRSSCQCVSNVLPCPRMLV